MIEPMAKQSVSIFYPCYNDWGTMGSMVLLTLQTARRLDLDGGRGLGFTGGHFHNNWADDDLRKFMLNAIIWTAKVEVPEGGVSTPTPTQEELDAYL